MARMSSLLRMVVLVTSGACSGFAEWHFRKAANPDKRSSGGDTLQPLVQDLSNASLHAWNFNADW